MREGVASTHQSQCTTAVRRVAGAPEGGAERGREGDGSIAGREGGFLLVLVDGRVRVRARTRSVLVWIWVF